MQITPIRTEPVSAGLQQIEEVFRAAVADVGEDVVVVVSSKIVALCEGSTAPLIGTDREMLIRQQADLYLGPELSDYGHHFTVKHNTLIGAAGIDESNADGQYVLWPRDPQVSANTLRAYIRATYGTGRVGVLIVDSTSYPLRRGSVGVPIAHSGFRAVKSYVGQPDIFGRELKLETASIAGGLAAAAVLAMGEGNEQTPIALVSGLPSIEFVGADPTDEELGATYLSIEEDVFAPFWQHVPWEKGGSDF